MIRNPQFVARALGGVATGNQISAPGPGHSPVDLSMSVSIGPECPDGFLVHSFAGDDPIACRDYVRWKIGLPEFQPSANLQKVSTTEEGDHRPTPNQDRTRYALEVWRTCGPPSTSLVETYLTGRGLDLDDLTGEAIRFHPGLKYDDRTLPAMVALLRDIRTNEPCGVHRTFLEPDGTKVDRRMLGRAKGAAIKLDGDESVTMGLTIAEGVESALAGRMAGFRPCWALGSASAIAAFPVLPGIEALTVLAETDDGGANWAAVNKCARAWLEAGAEVLVVNPRQPGDMNDVIRRACA